MFAMSVTCPHSCCGEGDSQSPRAGAALPEYATNDHTGKGHWSCYKRSVLTGREVKVYGGAQAPMSHGPGIQTTARVHVNVCDVIDTPSFVLR